MATYYVSQVDGNDSYNGLYPTFLGGTDGPWLTISKADDLAGDQSDNYVLLRCGGLWRESYIIGCYGTSGHPFTLGSYGTGDLPIICGSNLFTSWTNESGYLWYTAANAWDSYFVAFNGTPGWRETAKNDLDANMDFWYDATNDRVYVYSTGGNPNTVWTNPGVEIAVRPRAIWTDDVYDKDYINIENINLYGTGCYYGWEGAALHAKRCDNWTVIGVEIGVVAGQGIQTNGCKNWTILYCTLLGWRDCYPQWDASGISINDDGAGYESSYVYIHHNTINYWQNCAIMITSWDHESPSTYCEVSYNDCSHTSSGVYLIKADHCSVHHNICNDNLQARIYGEEYGLALETGNYNEFHHNSCTNGMVGTEFWGYVTGEPWPASGTINNNLYHHNIVSGNVMFGFLIYEGCSSNSQIYDNIIFNNGQGGITISEHDATGTGNLVYNNTLYHNDTDANQWYADIYFGNTCAGWTVRNNLCFNTNRLCFRGGVTFGGTHDHNCYYRASGNVIKDGATYYTLAQVTNFEATAIAADPELANAGGTSAEDYKILSSSPCRDTGTASGLTLTLDYFENTIPYGVGPDIGAHEYTGGEEKTVPLRVTREIAGTSTAISSVSGIVKRKKRISGTSAAVSSVLGVVGKIGGAGVSGGETRGIDTWAQLIRLPNPNIKILCEALPAAYYVCGSGWTSEGSDTYSHACVETGVTSVAYNGVSLTIKVSVAEVKAADGSWYFDFYGQMIYVHGPSDENLSSGSNTDVVMAFCRKDFATAPYYYGNREYRPLIRQDSFPAMDLAVDDIVEGMYRFNFSSFSLNNDGWFDTAVEEYIWTNRVVVIKIGGEALPYSEYQTFFVGRISDFSVSDELVVFTLKDMRVGSLAQIPIDHYWITDYPNMDPDDEDKAIPLFYGVKSDITPICIDTTAGTGGKWKICDSRPIKEITEVKKNKKVLTPTTQYTVDLTKGEFTLLVPFHKDKGHVLKVKAKGFVAGSNNLIEKGGAIAKDILKTYLGWTDDELDLDSFTNTDSLRTYLLDIYLDTDEDSRQVLQTIGRSVVAFFSPTENGKLSFMAYEPTIEAGTLELFDEDFYADWKVIKDDSWIRHKVQVSYGQNPTTDEYLIVEVTNDEALFKYGLRETLSIVTYLRSESDATNVAGGVLDMVSKPITVFSSTFGLKGFTLFPTRKVVVTRSRAADATGEFDAKVFRIKQVVKNPTTETTQVIGQDDLQTLGEIFCYVCYSCQTCYAQEVSCSVCYACQICNATQEGCLTCDTCELCVTTEGGCQTCDVCEVCNTCQSSVGECATCQICNVCAVCNICQSNVTTCVTCQVCNACVYCNVCQINVTSCTSCELCNTCDSCNTCQVSVKTCLTCQACYGCQTVYSPCPGACDICNVCDSCDTCQLGVKTCTTCQVCDTCEHWYTCYSCQTCQLCYSAQHPSGCAVCNTCQYCVAAQDCTSCDVCNVCQGSCYICEICVSYQGGPP